MKLYRTMQILQNMFNFCFQYWLFPTHKFIVMNAAVLGTYGAIKLHGPRGIIMGVTAALALVYLSVMFKSLGKLYDVSESSLGSWKMDGNKVMRKFVKSSPNIRCEVSSFYSVKKATVIVIWGTVFNFATNMLLSF
jgi:hypothetical protein